MTRGQLDEHTLKVIDDKLPNIGDLQKLVWSLSPDFISIKFSPESTIPIAAVCLRDAVGVLVEARVALHEAYACQIWHREKSDEPNETTAIFLGRFYVDDVALRLYAAQEHLAYAIVFLLEIDDHTLEPYIKRRTSKASIVGQFLRNERPNHPITQAVTELFRSPEWPQVMKYRGKLVHEQPPLVEGLGIAWKRDKRWKKTEHSGMSGFLLGIGGGDEPEYSVGNLLDLVQPALFHFARTLTAVLDFYITLLEHHGIMLDQTEGKLEVKLI